MIAVERGVLHLHSTMDASIKEQELLRKNQSLRRENQLLRDEIARLKSDLTRLQRVIYQLAVVARRHL